MAKKNMLERDLKRLRLLTKYKQKRFLLQKELKNAKKKKLETITIYKKIEKLPRNSSHIRVRNRCWKTGRPHGFYRYFGLCRNALRELTSNGLIPGLKKSSW